MTSSIHKETVMRQKKKHSLQRVPTEHGKANSLSMSCCLRNLTGS